MRWKIQSVEPDDNEISDALGIIAMIVAALDVAGWLCLVVLSLVATSDPAAKGLGIPLGWLITGLFVLTGAPGLALAWRGGAPRTALGFAAAFPLGFMVMYAALTIAF